LEKAEFGKDVAPAFLTRFDPVRIELISRYDSGTVLGEASAFALGDIRGDEDEEGDGVACPSGGVVKELVCQHAGAEVVAVVAVTSVGVVVVAWVTC